ncbi:MAG: DUF4175 domain-containing protein, partial [Shimia sp.]
MTKPTAPIHADLPPRARRAIGWTRAGMVAERITGAFWPFWSIALAAVGALMLGLHQMLPLEVVWAAMVLTILGLLVTAYMGFRRFAWPRREEAEARLDATLPGRPIGTLRDRMAIGAGDPAAQRVWQAHRDRMRDRAATATAVPGNLRIARRDPYALRYVAVLLLAVGVLFGSILRVGEVGDLAPGSAQAALGPSWEGWVEPPAYTRLPTIYLPDITDQTLPVPEGSRITIRLYGEVGDLTVAETVSARTDVVPVASAAQQTFDVTQAGRLEIAGPGGRAWEIAITPDQPPAVDFVASISAEEQASWELSQAFQATDDYAVVAGQGRFALDLSAVDRRHGLAVEPDAREPLTLDLPMTIAGDRSDFTETLGADLSEHPWANLPVSLQLEVTDAAQQLGLSPTRAMTLPGRRFFDPMAKAVIEQRRDILWSKQNARRVAQMLRAASYRPDDVFRSQVSALRMRLLIDRIELLTTYGFTPEQEQRLADDMWALALQLEEGDLADAAERLRRAQERLQEAIENGATDEEIARLMQELREAMQDYMQQLAESQPEGQDSQPQNPENMQEMTQSDLDEMLDRLQQLMEEGRMQEAQELLEQLQRMMENMQVTEGQQGQQGQQGEGQEAMEGLAETLREQQGLSDEAFRDLQEQFNPGQQGDQQQGQQGQQGQQQPGQQPGQQGQGQPPGQEGEGQQGQQQGQGQAQGQQQGQGQGDMQGSLAQRQQQLRNELQRQQQTLPGAGTPEGDSARENLGRAGEAMDRAGEALEQGDLAEAIDNQSEAIEALREGMRDLADAMQQ